MIYADYNGPDIYICESCYHVSFDVNEVDCGGPEEFWGATVHHEQMENCCESCNGTDINTLKDYQTNGWPSPRALDDFMEEHFTP